MANAKKSVKKVAPKKAAVKKAPVVQEIKPLDSFEGYNVTTPERDPQKITFGCGAVTVARKDLITYAEALENKEQAAAFKTLAKVASNYDSEVLDAVLDMNEKEIESLLAIKRTKSPAVKAFSNLRDESSSHYTVQELLNITPVTLRRLAATPKDRQC